ncbi:MAG TPA: hypothetical protein VFX12_02185 [Vicinamibacterales bacterium]|nr:hypothetical protein [Vicinamibacterales bacterium]
MLWYKAWLETRWRFLIGLLVLVCSAAATVFTYPKVLQLLPLVPPEGAGGELGRRITEAAALARTYRGFVWSQGFGQDLMRMVTLFAALLGVGGVFSGSSGAGSLFTLSMPVSRNRLLGTRTAIGLVELLVLAIGPALVIPLLSPAVGQRYAIDEALVHGVCLFAAGSAFFSLAMLLSTIFSDAWRPLLVTLAIALVLAFCGQVFDGSGEGIFGLMAGDVYFRTGALPWWGLAISAGTSGLLLYGAAATFARRDF